MKSLVLAEMALLVGGNLLLAKRLSDKPWPEIMLSSEFFHNLLAIAILTFVLLLIADAGYEGTAAALGAIIVFSYLAVSAKELADGLNKLLRVK